MLRSQHLYKSFLRHCCNYGLWQGECEDDERGRDRESERKERGSDRGPACLEQLGARRQAKIQRSGALNYFVLLLYFSQKFREKPLNWEINFRFKVQQSVRLCLLLPPAQWWAN